ncbi:Alpha-adducin [Linnemannia elongata]|nr:Alpha-adducin [Linnemannia elongata]
MPIPKAELHLHIEGTLEPELAFDLAARNGVELPYVDVEDLRKAYDFEDLQSFLNLYYELLAVLRTERDFEDLADAYLARAAAQGVRHAEIFFDPQAHIARGSAGSALKTLEAAKPYLDRITGVGLDSSEVGHPPAKFREVYDAAAALGLHRVAHVGEEGPPEYIVEALDVLGVERVDHGLRCMEDTALVERLVRECVPLTLCPLSNVRLRVVDTLADYPLPAMLDAGLLCTVNSDDPAYFGGYADDNFEAVRKTLGLTEDCMRKLARNSFLASFLEDDEQRRARYLAEVEAYEF